MSLLFFLHYTYKQLLHILLQKALRPEAESFQAYGRIFGGSDILFALQAVVPLLQERSQHRRGLHIKIEEIHRKSDRKEAQHGSQQNQRDFDKLRHRFLLPS